MEANKNLYRSSEMSKVLSSSTPKATRPGNFKRITHHIYQERIRGGACNATVGWVESLLENDVTYGCGKSIHSNFHSSYKESKDSRYIHWLEPPGVK